MCYPLVKNALRLRVEDGGVPETYGGDGEGHNGAGRGVVAAVVCRVDLSFCREGVTFLARKGSGLLFGSGPRWYRPFIGFRYGRRLQIAGRFGHDLRFGWGYVPLDPGDNARVGADERPGG